MSASVLLNSNGLMEKDEATSELKTAAALVKATFA